MLDLDEQIRRYLDATAPAVDVERIAPTTEHNDAFSAIGEDPRDHGRRVRIVAIAASIAILAIGVAGMLALRDGTTPGIEPDDAAPTFEPTPLQTAPEPSISPTGQPVVTTVGASPSTDAALDDQLPVADDGTGVALEWTQVDLPGDEPFTLLEHGGGAFRLADDQGRWYTSSNGIEWEITALDDPVPPLEAGPWVPHPAVAHGSTVTLVATDSPVVIVDVDSGRVERSDEGPTLTGDGPVVAAGALGTVVVDGPGSDGEGATRAWFTGDGLEWRAITSAGPFGRPSRARVAAIDEGFVALIANETDGTGSNFLTTGNELWFSADGSAWELRDAAVELPFFPQAFLPWGDGAIGLWSADWDSPSPSTDGMILVTADTATVVAVDDIADIDALADESPAHVDVGPLGIAFAYTLDVLDPTGSGQVDGPFHLVEISVDGTRWSRRTFPSELEGPQRVAVGTESIAVLTSSLGNPPWGAQSLWIGTPAD